MLNTDFIALWLQRLSLVHTKDKDYNATIGKKVVNLYVVLFGIKDNLRKLDELCKMISKNTI